MQRAGAVIWEMPFGGIMHTVVAYADLPTLIGLQDIAEHMFDDDWVFTNPEWLTYPVVVHQCRIQRLADSDHGMASWNGSPTFFLAVCSCCVYVSSVCLSVKLDCLGTLSEFLRAHAAVIPELLEDAVEWLGRPYHWLLRILTDMGVSSCMAISAGYDLEAYRGLDIAVSYFLRDLADPVRGVSFYRGQFSVTTQGYNSTNLDFGRDGIISRALPHVLDWLQFGGPSHLVEYLFRL